MLERAARAVAIHRGWREDYDDEFDAERYHLENGPASYFGEARAFLMAVREPDDAFALAATDGHDTYWNYEADGRSSGPSETFSAIIDAILNGDA